ncbi:12682_t:CDS:2 [Ambispora leptoticha]|uniref:Succinate-semialdehyde dehydrogenase n=1 Tax=Ambispora leptoticha TaxID=144679 RepID=A0A9N9ANH2_9GLOM|nr:12682_t:CDS:2 [Ambispora leptoticha]
MLKVLRASFHNNKFILSNTLTDSSSKGVLPSFINCRYFTTKTVNMLKLKDPSLFREASFISGAWVKSVTGKTFTVLDPATENEIGKAPDMDKEDTQKAIKAASEAFKSWSGQTAKYRHDVLKNWYSLIIEHQQDLASILTQENGKPVSEALGEIKYGANFIEWFAEEATRTYGDVIPSPIKNQRFVVQKQPVGVVGIITPWNFPNAMITRKVGAALAAGCTVVVKPASETPFSALAMAELANRAGLPKGVYNVVTSHEKYKEVGLEMTTNPIIKKISFTGSTAVGKMLMEQSSSTLKKVTLELGGNAPFIVFDDADIDAAVEGAITSKFRSSGQTCVCANRIFVQSSVHAEFASHLTQKVSNFRVGNGFDSNTTHGPLISRKAIEKCTRHVDDAVSKGAEILIGGKHVGGNFYEPTVLSNLHPEMLIAQEETFGPIAGIFKFDTEEHVIEMANSTESGLAGYFYSRDIGRCWRVAEALEVGMVGINTGIISSCEAPFGGIKQSGIGREGSKYGIDEYLNIKYINFGGI